MEIRLAKEQDLIKLAEIERICFPAQEAATKQQFQQRFLAFPDCFLVAVIEGQIVGFINGAMISTRFLIDQYYEDTSLYDFNHPYQSIFGLAVLPTFQHRGIAQKLMNAFIDLALIRGKKGLVLTCKKELIDFYKQFGYSCLGVSQSIHGGVTWYDMFLELESHEMCFIPMQYYHLNKCSILFQQCFMQEPWNETWTYEQSYQRLKEMLLSPYALGYVLYRDNQLIGMILGRQMTYLEKKELWIDEVCILPELHGQHLGSYLLQQTKKECIKLHIERMVLQTIRGFLSEGFYSKNNFVEEKHLICMSCDI